MAEWHLTPQAAASTLTDEQLTVLMPAMTYRLTQTSTAAILAKALSGGSPAGSRAGRSSRPSRAVTRHDGRTYGSADRPLRGRELMNAIGQMQMNGDVGRGRAS